MSETLYQKYRPDTFEQLIGQDQSVTPLQRALKNEKIGHAYLFSGPRGCGKTTSARILARCLNCSGKDGKNTKPVATPCGKCPSCVDLATGSDHLPIDVIEIDAASNRGVEEARELKDKLNFTPVRDRFKIVILDEAHMITPVAFNSLLKVIEEPPAYVKFIFATTEPEKVMETIRSRTLQYFFKLVPSNILEPYLEEITKKEKINVEDGVLDLVVKAGGGSVRDALSVLDKILASSDKGKVEFEIAQNLLGFIPNEKIIQISEYMLNGNVPGVLNELQDIQQSLTDVKQILNEWINFLSDLLLIKANPELFNNSNFSEDEKNQVKKLAETVSVDQIIKTADYLNENLTIKDHPNTPRFLQLVFSTATLQNQAIPSVPPAFPTSVSPAVPTPQPPSNTVINNQNNPSSPVKNPLPQPANNPPANASPANPSPKTVKEVTKQVVETSPINSSYKKGNKAVELFLNRKNDMENLLVEKDMVAYKIFAKHMIPVLVEKGVVEFEINSPKKFQELLDNADVKNSIKEVILKVFELDELDLKIQLQKGATDLEETAVDNAILDETPSETEIQEAEKSEKNYQNLIEEFNAVEINED